MSCCLLKILYAHIQVYDVRVDPNEQTQFRNRKGNVTINVLGVCSQDAQFIYVLSGWEGYAADSRVLKSTLSRPCGFKVPAEQYYLVDVGYSNAQGFLAPFRGQRYHLNEWREGCHPINTRECFNMRHSGARNVIERCFGMFKNRWAILRSPSFYPVRTHNIIVIACCLLHNLIRHENARDPLDDETKNLVSKPVEEPAEDDAAISTIERQSDESIYKLITLRTDPQSTIEEDEREAPRMLVEGNPTHTVNTQDTGKNWSTVHDMVYETNTSGFGWDDDRQLKVAERDVWEAYIKDRATGGEARDVKDINETGDEDLDDLDGLENSGQNQTPHGQHSSDDMTQPPPIDCEAVSISRKRKRTSPSNDVIKRFKEMHSECKMHSDAFSRFCILIQNAFCTRMHKCILLQNAEMHSDMHSAF
ncbi:protein ALP1-like [Senna tora]|uniref:Protein ALP1-like n=1 Tax=Senna tora TaxID=362788 RepID=A0A834SHS8_9FABA|nr:protein ALP1-like [Senna tora]